MRKEKNRILKVKVGDKFDAYHDGKTSTSRLSVVTVIDIIPIYDLHVKYLKKWKKAINKDFNDSLIRRIVHYVDGPQRFWDWNCETFIFGTIPGDKDTENDPMMFARRPNGSWYGVNWNFMLDITGNVRKKNLPHWKLCAKECGQTIKWNAKEGKFDYFDIKTGKKIEEDV